MVNTIENQDRNRSPHGSGTVEELVHHLESQYHQGRESILNNENDPHRDSSGYRFSRNLSWLKGAGFHCLLPKEPLGALY